MIVKTFNDVERVNIRMPKKPFSIRVEQSVINRYKALSAVLNLDSAKLLEELVDQRENSLTENERNAYESLLKIWKEQS